MSSTFVLHTFRRVNLHTAHAVFKCLLHKQHLHIGSAVQTFIPSIHLPQTDASRMSCFTQYVLVLIAVLCVQDSTCSIDSKQLAELLQNIQSSEQQDNVSRRNIAGSSNIPGTGIFQEASSRDLDVDFAVGVKDDGSDSDSAINNHSYKSAYLPNSVFDKPNPGLHALEEPPSNELNVGLFVDPKNGISYYSPGYAPKNSFVVRPNTVPKGYDGSSPVNSISQANPGISPISYPVLLHHHRHFPLKKLFNFGRYATVSPTNSFLENPSNTFSEFSRLPYPYQNNPTPTLGTDGYFVVTPLRTDSSNNAETALNFNNLQQSTYPYQQPFQIPYNSKSLGDVSDQVPDISHQQPITVNSVYYSTYPESYQLFSSAKPIQQVPNESSRQFSQPVAFRQKPQEPQIILDEQGTPVMSAQPYGERQVGTFRLRHDNGYQVSVSLHDRLKFMNLIQRC